MRDIYLILILIFTFLFSIFLLSGCATAVPDVPVCMEVDITEGRCTWILSGKTQMVNEKSPLNNKTWWQMRPTNVSVPLSSWVELKKFIITVCARSKKCSEITDWESTIESVDSDIKKKEPR